MRAFIVVASLLAAVAGCVGSSGGQTPGDQQGADLGFPSLREVPRDTIANTDAAHWAQVQAEVLAAGAAMRASPRAQPTADAETPADFVEGARRDLEQARQAHEPSPPQ